MTVRSVYLTACLAGLLSGVAYVAMTHPLPEPPKRLTVPVGRETTPPLVDPRFADWVRTEAPRELVAQVEIDLARFMHDKEHQGRPASRPLAAGGNPGPLIAAADPGAIPEMTGARFNSASAPRFGLPPVSLPAPLPPVFAIPPQAQASPR